MPKLKCRDNIVREFKVSKETRWGQFTNASCLECGYNFGVGDYKVLKPKFIDHVCEEAPDYNKYEHLKSK